MTTISLEVLDMELVERVLLRDLEDFALETDDGMAAACLHLRRAFEHGGDPRREVLPSLEFALSQVRRVAESTVCPRHPRGLGAALVDRLVEAIAAARRRPGRAVPRAARPMGHRLALVPAAPAQTR